MIIAVDFDGTCVSHEFPFIGKSIGAEPILKQLVQKGHKIILNTMRDKNHMYDKKLQKVVATTRYDRSLLEEAEDWFKTNEIDLFSSNINPEQRSWTYSPKVYAHIYIDDAALGIPLIHEEGFRPYVDWSKVEIMLKEKGVL